jgi:hypothetical protein
MIANADISRLTRRLGLHNRSDWVRMPSRNSQRQHPRQQLGRSTAAEDRTRGVVLVAELGPSRRGLPGPQIQASALLAVGRELSDLDPWLRLKHLVELLAPPRILATEL